MYSTIDYSLLHLVHAIACANPSTIATSLICVKNMTLCQTSKMEWFAKIVNK